MGVVTLVLLGIGAVGAAMLIFALVVGELADVGGADADGPLSLPVAAAFIGVFGFAGALGAALVGGSGPAAALAGGAAGLLGALPASWFAVRIIRGLTGMHTDGTITAASLVGTHGVVLTRVPVDGYGEVRIMLGGQPLKLNAKSGNALPAGTAVLVVEAPSESSVVVVESPTVP